MKDYYEELEVSSTASQEVIEKVYKVLAKKYHPDMNQGSDKQIAEEKFKKISEAYEILSNEEKRKNYNIQLEQEKPTVSYEEYMSVINEKNRLTSELNNIKNEFYNFKNSNSFNNSNTQSTYNQNNANAQRNNFNSNYQNTSQNYNYQNNNSQKKTYYYTNTGKPASAFDYLKYRIKKFFSDSLLIILGIFAIIFFINSLLNVNLFSFFIK